MGAIGRLVNPRAEDGIALVLALTVLVCFSITTVAAVTMANSTTHTAASGGAQQDASAFAEAGINAAESIFYAQNTAGGNPSAANLLGCAGVTGVNDTNGPSNCASPSPIALCLATSSPCTAGTAGTAGVVGYFSGANPGSYAGKSVAASTWLIVSTGYARAQTGTGLVTRTLYAKVTISPLGQGGVASVWNHVFITAPLVAGVCQLDFSGSNGVSMNVPIYTVGNLCLGSNTVAENGQAVDLEVGGKLYIPAGGQIGASSVLPITSGVVVGGCTSVSVSAATTACGSGSFNYWVGTTSAYISQSAPGESASDIMNDYSTFDPGPKHTCLAGTTPAPLADNKFDFSIVAGEGTTVAPGISGSGSSGGAMELAPASSYACISKNGASAGYLIWNNGASPITVSGITVPAKTLAINGSIYFDSDVTISQTVTYMGTGVIEASGGFTFNGNSTAVCAVSGGTNICDSAHWQGTSGNNQMMTLVALRTNGAGFNFPNNSQWFQGSLWTQPSSSLTIVKNTTTIQGPMAVGTLGAGSNGAVLKPMPVIKNMPAGAPIPPNTNVTISAPSYS